MVKGVSSKIPRIIDRPTVHSSHGLLRKPNSHFVAGGKPHAPNKELEHVIGLASFQIASHFQFPKRTIAMRTKNVAPPQTATQSKTPNPQGDMRPVKKWRLAASSAAATAMYLGTLAPVDGDIVHVTTPLSIGLFNSNVNWDVDGNGVTDFHLQAYTSSSLSINGGGAFVNLIGSAEDGIEGFDTVASQFDVGQTLPSGYFFGQSNAAFRTMLASSYYLGNDALGWDSPTQFVGFRFIAEGPSIGYGWASVTIDLAEARLTINEWAYEDSGGAIHLGATSSVPEPASHGLALLAFGVAGLRRWRCRNLNSDS